MLVGLVSFAVLSHHGFIYKSLADGSGLEKLAGLVAGAVGNPFMWG